MNENESLKKSHSKFSNFKLTLLCLLSALFFGLFFIALALYFSYFRNWTTLAAVIVSALLSLLSAILFLHFER